MERKRSWCSIVAALLLLMPFVRAAYGQGILGTIDFRTRLPAAALDAPVLVYGQSPGPLYSAGLYHEGTLIPGSVTTFYDPMQNPAQNPLLARYVVPTTVFVPGTTPGQENFVVQMRVWLASAGSYEAAPFGDRGLSAPMAIAMLGGDSANRPNHLPPSFTGIVIMPEPSIITLAILGTALIFGCRAFCRNG